MVAIGNAGVCQLHERTSCLKVSEGHYQAEFDGPDADALWHRSPRAPGQALSNLAKFSSPMSIETEWAQVILEE